MFERLSFLLFLHVLFGITLVSSTGCLPCLSACRSKRQRTAIVPIGGQWMDISKFGTSQSPKSIMCSEMQSHGHQLNTNESETSDEGILWFNVNADLMQQNDTKKNVNSILATVYAYDITHTLHFLGQYLPLKNSTNTNQFQLVFDYFAQFQHGIKRVDLQMWFAQFEPMRERFLNLWNIITKPLCDGDIPDYVTEFNKNGSFSLPSDLIHRMSKRKPGIKSRKPKAHHKEHFWNFKWINYKLEPRVVIDKTGAKIQKKEFHHFMETALSRIVVWVDRIKSIFLDHDDRPGDLHSVFDILRSRMVLQILYRNMFGNGIESVRTHQNLKVIRRMLWGDDRKRKLLMRLRMLLGSSILKFLVANSEKKLKIEISPKWIPAHANKADTFQFQISWDSQMFYGNVTAVSEDMSLFETINQYITFLSSTPGVAEHTKFCELLAMKYGTQLVTTVLEFTIAGGKCGIRKNDNSEFVESFICELPSTTAAMHALFTIPRRFVQRSANTEEYWQLLADVSGLNFKDITDVSTDSETSESAEGNEVQKPNWETPKNEHGLMFEDVLRHDE